MRGQQVRFNENGDGEVDEQFWAQAAADQAAGRAAAENEDGESTVYLCLMFLKLIFLKAEMDQIYPSIRSSSTTTMTMARALMMVLMETVRYRRMLKSKTSWLSYRARRGGSDQNSSIMQSVPNG